MNGDPRISSAAQAKIAQRAEPVYFSAASTWEISTKHRIGKLPGVESLIASLASTLIAEGFNELGISVKHAQVSGGLAGHHEDPFDRILVAQALNEGLTMLSNEKRFDLYGVTRIW